MELLMERPDEHAAIRLALARLAPHIGRGAGDPPLAILAALRACFSGPPPGGGGHRGAVRRAA